jgi:hypothetical protein
MRTTDCWLMGEGGDLGIESAQKSRKRAGNPKRMTWLSPLPGRSRYKFATIRLEICFDSKWDMVVGEA